MAPDDTASAGAHSAATSQTLSLDSLVSELRAARRAARQAHTQPVRTRDLPSPEAVESIVQRLHSALFPRHRGAHDEIESAVDYFVGYNLNEALLGLGEQIRRELRFANGHSEQRDIEAATTDIVGSFAAELPRIYTLLASDIRAAYDGDPSAKSAEEVLLSFPGIRAIIHHPSSHRASAVPARHADSGAHHFRARPFFDRHRHPSRCADRR